MEIYYFESPHKQILEDFRAKVVKVHDGDTITVETDFRDFNFPVRFLNTDAPELKDPGGRDSQSWLAEKILNKEVDIIINRSQRVGKYGRLLGKIFSEGVDINEESIRAGKATPFGQQEAGEIPNLNKDLNIKQWV